MDGLDITGIATLALLGAALVVLGKRVVERRLDLALGGYSADTADPATWHDMNVAAGTDILRLGCLFAAIAAAGAGATLVLPDGAVGAVCLVLTCLGGILVATAAARHSVAPTSSSSTPGQGQRRPAT